MARVLVVDDEPVIVQILKEALSQAGHEVVTATGGEQAIDRLSNGRPAPDIILLDLLMPRVGGREVIDFIRCTPTLAGLPVVIVTGAAPSDAGFPPEHTYQALLTKPFYLSEVVRTVHDLTVTGRRPEGDST